MTKLTCASIVLSSLCVVATLTSQAVAASDAEQTASVWSSRDGILHFGRSSETDPDVETFREPSGRSTDVEPSRSRNALICEPSR